MPRHMPPSPREQAEQAKADRDLHTEVATLVDADADMHSVVRFPLAIGDTFTVVYEHMTSLPAFTETYEIMHEERLPSDFLTMQLKECSPADDEKVARASGCFGGLDAEEALSTMWMEAGPARLKIMQGGRVVHDGPASLT